MEGEPDLERKKGAGITQTYRVIVSPFTSSFKGAGPRLKNSGLTYGNNIKKPSHQTAE
jgi:hypothetical protein